MDAVAQRWKESLPPEWCTPKPSISCRSLASKAFARAEAAARLNYLEGIYIQPPLPGQEAQQRCLELSDKWLCNYHPRHLPESQLNSLQQFHWLGIFVILQLLFLAHDHGISECVHVPLSCVHGLLSGGWVLWSPCWKSTPTPTKMGRGQKLSSPLCHLPSVGAINPCHVCHKMSLLGSALCGLSHRGNNPSPGKFYSCATLPSSPPTLGPAGQEAMAEQGSPWCGAGRVSFPCCWLSRSLWTIQIIQWIFINNFNWFDIEEVGFPLHFLCFPYLLEKRLMSKYMWGWPWERPMRQKCAQSTSQRNHEPWPLLGKISRTEFTKGGESLLVTVQSWSVRVMLKYTGCTDKFGKTKHFFFCWLYLSENFPSGSTTRVSEASYLKLQL